MFAADIQRLFDSVLENLEVHFCTELFFQRYCPFLLLVLTNRGSSHSHGQIEVVLDC